MDAQTDPPVSELAAAIAEPARTRMLYCLVDGRARTGTELAVIAGVSPSTASVHLARLVRQKLVQVQTQGRYRYYSLAGLGVAEALEALAVVAGPARPRFEPRTPPALRAARSCYDHLAGALAVGLLERFLERGWLVGVERESGSYELTETGTHAFERLGVNVTAARSQRRRFACACLDWSERRPHVGGALGGALLETALKRRWVVKELDSRALRLTPAGRHTFKTQVGFDAA